MGEKKIETLLLKMANNNKGVKFVDLVKVCNHYFGKPRQKGTSHRLYKTPWAGNPRVNIQSNHGEAKAYQVMQVLDAIEKLKRA